MSRASRGLPLPLAGSALRDAQALERAARAAWNAARTASSVAREAHRTLDTPATQEALRAAHDAEDEAGLRLSIALETLGQ